MDIRETKYKEWIKRKNRLYFALMYSRFNLCDRTTILSLIDRGLITDTKIKRYLVLELYKRFIVDTVSLSNPTGDKEKTLRRLSKELHYPYETIRAILKNNKKGA